MSATDGPPPVAVINPDENRCQFARKSVSMVLSVLLLRVVVYFGLVIGGCTFVLFAFLVGGLTVFLFMWFTSIDSISVINMMQTA